MKANRRQFLSLTGLAATAVGLAGCSSGGGSSSNELTFCWWGNDVRNKNTDNAIAAYEKANAGVTIKAQPGEWSSYWDKLATQTAGGTAPDVIQMDMAYISEYGQRGALLDLEAAGADVSKFAEGTVDSGRIDGKLYGINAGINTPIILANTKLIESFGLKLPDDKTWTFESMGAFAAEITAKSGGKVVGMASPIVTEVLFEAWLRQQGKDLFDGNKAAFTAADVQGWYDLMLGWVKAKATPDANQINADFAKTMDQQDFTIGKDAMMLYWSNQVEAVDKAAGTEMQIMRFPSLAGKATERKAWYKASMLWSASAKSKNPDGAVKLINWWVNSKECADINLAERGVPANTEIRDYVTPKLSADQQRVAKFISDIAPEISGAPQAPPAGGGKLADILFRHGSDVLFGKSSSADAAKAAVDELTQSLQG